ncbi:MAG: insulinase family protein [Deltaproteobacteria bacterium]|nr:insulinase family protein [Deltaproteobacteria bacterium]
MSLDAPKPIRTVLDNGLRVVCVPHAALHTAAVSLHVRVGSRFETRELNGCSHFLEHMLYRGTASFASAHEQALAIERLGGTLYAATHSDFGLMSLSLPPENLEAALGIFAEVMTSPRFTAIDLERAIIREEILETLDDNGHQIDPDNLSRALMFGDHPLGFPITGSIHTLQRMGVDDLRRHHALHYTAANSVLCLAGAIDPDDGVKIASRLFGSLPTGQVVAATPPPRTQKHPRYKYVENQMSQTDLRLAFRAPGEHDPQEPAAEVLLRVLDDGMSTRLYARICDEKGLCYDVSADYETYEDDGVLDLGAVVQHERAPVVMRELCEIVSEIARDGPTDEELDKTRMRHGFESRQVIDDADALADFHGLSALAGIADSVDARRQEILSVTAEQVRDVARRIFRPEGVCGVAVGLLEEPQKKALEQIVKGFK